MLFGVTNQNDQISLIDWHRFDSFGCLEKWGRENFKCFGFAFLTQKGIEYVQGFMMLGISPKPKNKTEFIELSLKIPQQ